MKDSQPVESAEQATLKNQEKMSEENTTENELLVANVDVLEVSTQETSNLEKETDVQDNTMGTRSITDQVTGATTCT